MNAKVIEFRKNWKQRQLNLKQLPKKDQNTTFQERTQNVYQRLGHLTDTLLFLKNIYDQNKDLYNDEFFAFVGNSIVRCWPNKDLPFTSVEYYNAIKENLKVKAHYEHFTPISFFRDLFAEKDITRDDIFDALKYYYRVVIITEDENRNLNQNGFKTTRPISGYEKSGIKILEEDIWNNEFNEIDTLHS